MAGLIIISPDNTKQLIYTHGRTMHCIQFCDTLYGDAGTIVPQSKLRNARISAIRPLHQVIRAAMPLGSSNANFIQDEN